ncbi:MAG: carbon-nitrogen hydrolase family protein [Mariniblastus sp.]
MSRIKVAGVQMDIEFNNRDANLEKMELRLAETTSNGAELTVFPECTTTGYCFTSLDEAKEIAEGFDGPSVTQVHQWCQEKDTMVVFGFLELSGEKVFNVLALVGPSGLIGTYRKIHLPHLGIDRFTTPGDRPFEVIETPSVRIGMNICYDSSFPEAARVLAVKGADLITLPTNWPPTSGLTADVIPNARALENHVYFMSVNRIGTERGFEFIGKSKICDPRGANMAFADHANEAILYAEIDPEFARKKHLVSIPGEHEVHRMKDRRPDVYDPLSEPN